MEHMIIENTRIFFSEGGKTPPFCPYVRSYFCGFLVFRKLLLYGVSYVRNYDAF